MNGVLLQTAADRVRAQVWRMRGARLGAKSRVGPGASISCPTALVTEERLQVERGAFLKFAPQARVTIGAYTFIGFAAELDIAGELHIGRHVLVAPGVFITDHAHRRAPGVLLDAQGSECAAVRIGDDAWIGAKAVILPGVTVGAGAIVGAGAVVTHDVAPGVIVAGVPARVIGQR